MQTRDRAHRFGDWADLRELCQSGRGVEERSFYAGTHVGSRMEQVRRAISAIRMGWERYAQFRDELHEYLGVDPGLVDPEEQEIHELGMAALFSRRLEWSDLRTSEDGDDGALVRYYTSEVGYRSVFGLINRAFRADDITADASALRSAAFLIELLSIDLFNYRAANARADDFHGTVYRGMCVSPDVFARLRRAAQGPVEERYLSVPLAMVSTSLEPDRAMEFALREAAMRPGWKPVLWRIEVTGLPSALLDIYRAEFPSSVVTSLCAVPIQDLSYYSHEREVLLRGPFFQILRVRTERLRDRERINVVDACMLNSNRDHVTTIASNEGEDRRARDLFRRLVTLHRSGLCADRAAAYGATADAERYREITEEHRHHLNL
ncbi:hypothetical protein [Actinomadura sp. NPDC000600]|uniref:hypothetical protein n=1 Tax=Actinomadura sp. NPDC000600 TaxID=3154262 RepID=UPI0033912137